jgi:hypothetical protein
MLVVVILILVDLVSPGPSGADADFRCLSSHGRSLTMDGAVHRGGTAAAATTTATAAEARTGEDGGLVRSNLGLGQ